MLGFNPATYNPVDMLFGGQGQVNDYFNQGMAAGDRGFNQASAAGNKGLNDATNVATNYYNTAQNYLNPYAQGGTQSFNQWGQNLDTMNNNLNQQPNMGQYQWQQAQQTPQQYYQSIMTGYQQSPEAKYAQDVAERAGNRAAAASGMMGSGSFINQMQRNANDISQQDRQQYFNNVMGSNQAQMGQLQNYQNMQALYNQNAQNRAQMGYGATGQQSGNAMNTGFNVGNWNFLNGQNIGNWAMQNALGQMGMTQAGMRANTPPQGASQAGLENLAGLAGEVFF